MKCLIVDKAHPRIIQDLSDLGVVVDYLPDLTKEGILSIIGEYDGLIIRSKIKIDKAILSAASKLKFVARMGAGIDNLDLDELQKGGVEVINAPEGNRDTLAEHTLGMLLSMLHRIHVSYEQVKSHQWIREANRGEELMGKTVGILGFGNMGKAFAIRLQGFGVNIIAYDKYKGSLDYPQVSQVDMDEFYTKTDILSIHLPLSDETRNLVNEKFLGRFTKPIYLINTARGEIVSLKALKYCLDKNAILGVALDVLENEQIEKLNPAESRILDDLIKSGKVLITPHIAGWSHQSYVRINEVLVSKIHQQFLK